MIGQRGLLSTARKIIQLLFFTNLGLIKALCHREQKMPLVSSGNLRHKKRRDIYLFPLKAFYNFHYSQH